MTEQEAIERIEKESCYSENCHDGCLYGEENCTYSKAISALKEVQEYHKIGTVKECREAVEKSKPKPPKDSLKINPIIDDNGAYVDADIIVYLHCPNCGEMVGIDENIDKFCCECGQAIDENLEGMEDN